MPMRRRTLLGSIASTVAFTGCQSDGRDGTAGDSDDDGETDDSESPTATPSPTVTEGPPTVQVRTHDEYDAMLVGPDEMTLYLFEKDTQGKQASACDDGCAETWPPLTVDDEPTKSANVSADLQTFTRRDGKRQVMAGGWPLYYFATDDNPGDTKGQGVGGVWWILAPDGTPIQT